MICGVMYVRFKHTVIARPEGGVHRTGTRLEKEKHSVRFDFNDARGERRGSWDEVTELDFRGKSSVNILPSPVEAGLARLGQASDVMLMICYCALIGVNMHGIFTPHATPQYTSQDPKETGYPVWGTQANMQASRLGC